MWGVISTACVVFLFCEQIKVLTSCSKCKTNKQYICTPEVCNNMKGSDPKAIHRSTPMYPETLLWAEACQEVGHKTLTSKPRKKQAWHNITRRPSTIFWNHHLESPPGGLPQSSGTSKPRKNQVRHHITRRPSTIHHLLPVTYSGVFWVLETHSNITRACGTTCV
jgi:hypothetical protein